MIPQPPTSTLFPYTTLFRSITNSVVNTITVGLGPGFVAVNPKTNKIYVTLTGGCCADGNAVAVIDGSIDTVVNIVTVDLDPFIVAVNPRTNLVYVTHAGVDKITVIDGATDTVKATFSIGSEARAIAFDSNGKFVYVAARNINQLAVVDASNNTVVQYIPVGRRPHGVVFNPANGRIYVTNRNDGTVSVSDVDSPVGGIKHHAMRAPSYWDILHHSVVRSIHDGELIDIPSSDIHELSIRIKGDRPCLATYGEGRLNGVCGSVYHSNFVDARMRHVDQVRAWIDRYDKRDRKSVV